MLERKPEAAILAEEIIKLYGEAGEEGTVEGSMGLLSDVTPHPNTQGNIPDGIPSGIPVPSLPHICQGATAKPLSLPLHLQVNIHPGFTSC